MTTDSEKHVLGLSGGRDSAALAVHMRQHHPELEIEYFFTDTGKELPEVYEYLGRLEGFLGQPIRRLNPDRDFDFWLKQYNDFLPSPQTRWCTRQLKLRPFEQWLRPILAAGTTVYSYVAIRSDEEYREGYSSKHNRLVIKLPFKQAGVDKAGVLEILDGAGPRLAEVLRLAHTQRLHLLFLPAEDRVGTAQGTASLMAFEEAKAYEKNAVEHGSPFTWSQGESLEELERPARIAQIRQDHERRHGPDALTSRGSIRCDRTASL